MPWLPTEPEKVEFFEALDLDRRLIPRRLYHGTVGNRQRYLALKMPVAGDTESVTFVYADPGRDTTSEINTWGAAHVPFWDAIRAKGIRVEIVAIGAELDTVLRADRVLQAWAAAPGKDATGPTVKQEMAAIMDAIHRSDQEFLAQYGGMGEAGQRYVALHKLPEANLEDGVKIDEFSTYQETRFTVPA